MTAGSVAGDGRFGLAARTVTPAAGGTAAAVTGATGEGFRGTGTDRPDAPESAVRRLRATTSGASSFEGFLATELADLTRFAGVLTGDRQLGHDVLADALVKAGTRWSRIAAVDDPRAYVRRMVVNSFLDERRRTKRRPVLLTADTAQLDRPAGADPTAALESNDQLRALLDGLPAQQRAAVVLRYLLDQTDDEIAAAIGCRPATVRSHLSRALQRLRATVTIAPEESS